MQSKEHFAIKHEAMQYAYKSSASSTKAEQRRVIKAKGEKVGDKNAKAPAPTKNVRQMTPEERAELSKKVMQESKPDTDASVSPRSIILKKRVLICADALELAKSCASGAPSHE